MPPTSPKQEYLRLLSALGCPEESRDHLADELTRGTYQTALIKLSTQYPQLANLPLETTPEEAFAQISRTASPQDIATSLLEAVRSLSQELIRNTLPRLPIRERQTFLDYLKSGLTTTTTTSTIL